jgi:hypothetical protein
MTLVKNMPQVNAGIDLFIKRVGDMHVKYYREVVWAVFIEVLYQTPQFTGRAVANWNIGLGAPDFSSDSGLGDEVAMVSDSTGLTDAHQREDQKWIDYAIANNEPKIAQIQRGSKVYITNNVRGDDDNGKSSELYLESLQDSAYWSVKLREANKPYETAQETIMSMAARIGQSHGFEFKAGGRHLRDLT